MKQSLKPRYTLPDGTITVFSQAKLKTAILRRKNDLEKNGEKLSQQAILESIAEDTGISFSAIKHWCAGHNAPSDLDKVRDLACALNVDMNFLLEKEMEESVDMTATNDKIILTPDYSTTKGVIRSLYISMVDYIELFRKLGVAKVGDPFQIRFAEIYTSLLKARFDIPHKHFALLLSFATNYLQQFSCYLDFLDYIETTDNEDFPDVNLRDPNAYVDEYRNTYICPPCAPWFSDIYTSVNPDDKYCKTFEEALRTQIEWDNSAYAIDGTANELIISMAYGCLEEILADFREVYKPST